MREEEGLTEVRGQRCGGLNRGEIGEGKEVNGERSSFKNVKILTLSCGVSVGLNRGSSGRRWRAQLRSEWRKVEGSEESGGRGRAEQIRG